MGWIAYAVGWLLAGLLWTLAGASTTGRPPWELAGHGLLTMAPAAVLGVGVWRLTGRLDWNGRSAAFYATHALAMALYAVVYATSWMWPDVLAGRGALALERLRSSPVVLWNLLLGCSLYLVVAGFSHAIRAQRQAREDQRAAAEARLLAQQAQLAALRAQIHPHFLFNALHSVGALVSTDPLLADRALERLGDLLRHALTTEEEVPLRKEWGFTQDYLAFEQLRLGPRLTVELERDEAADPVLVPSLILQPLVENAVRHGISSRPEGGRIALSARVDGGQLLLSVADDGPGGGGGSSFGLGMGTVHRRLAALYGDRASLVSEHGPGGFTVTLRLPLGGARRAGAET